MEENNVKDYSECIAKKLEKQVLELFVSKSPENVSSKVSTNGMYINCCLLTV